jgi:NAD+ synthase (glutamine-hydrolysing)
VIVFPELNLSGYSNDDLFFQDALLVAVEDNLFELCRLTASLDALLVVGAPLRAEGALFNCALAIHQGQIKCVVPKTYLPNYREFYEKRYFASGALARKGAIKLRDAEVPFGNDIILTAPGLGDFALHVEICEDLWAPIPPSTYAALAGATLLVNLSASNATMGKREYRKLLAASQSGRCIAGYVYCAAGFGESTTDLAWDGHAMIYENGELLAESKSFQHEPSFVVADIDLDRIRQDRARTTSFIDCAQAHRTEILATRRMELNLVPRQAAFRLERRLQRFPFIPDEPEKLAERCAEIYAIQSQGLARRLEAASLKKVVIGISGGVDSAQALLVAVKAFDFLGYPRTGILCIDMPGFATSELFRTNAKRLMASLSVSTGEIDMPARIYLLVMAGCGLALMAFLFGTLYRYTSPGWPRRKGKPNLTRHSNPIFFWLLTVWVGSGALLSAWIVIFAVSWLVHPD